MKTPGLYIHIPFCRTKCPYCDFYSVTGLGAIPQFLEALLSEMEMAGPEWPAFDTVYIGGGTPSLLSASQLEKVVSGARRFFHLLSGTEITVETNPADLDLPYLTSLKEIGVNRLNVGVQSLDPGTLRFLGRRHSADQAVSALELSRRAGFDNLGLDLIYGVPGQSMDSWLATLRRAIEFSPEHISCYELTLEKDTPLSGAARRGDFSVPAEEELLHYFMATAQEMERSGYTHYEISNFSRGKANTSRHNQKYWDHTPYLGLGPAAHSFSGARRWWNYRSVENYIASLRAGNLPVAGSETLSPEQLRMEALFLGLRTRRGIDLANFQREHGCDLLREKSETISRLQHQGLLALAGGRLFPTRSGMSVADHLGLL